jgi:hypothetical protein
VCPTFAAIKIALDSLDKLIENHPSYASAYANRAQANRLLENHTSAAPDLAAIESILSDLSKAISLATPASPSRPVSAFQAKILSTAHTHRAYLLYRISKAENPQALPGSLCNVSNDQLEEMASHDFLMGGRYGDKVAQQMAVHTNPYAKMCGAIVREALKEEMKAFPQT